jgi:hypothetical protein
MPTISLDETLISLTEASKRLPGRPHVSTLWRWNERGVRGVRLETLVVAGRRYTSSEALERFVAATTAAADGERLPIRTPRQRQLAMERAERELAEDGLSTTRPSQVRGDRHGGATYLFQDEDDQDLVEVGEDKQ